MLGRLALGQMNSKSNESSCQRNNAVVEWTTPLYSSLRRRLTRLQGEVSVVMSKPWSWAAYSYGHDEDLVIPGLAGVETHYMESVVVVSLHTPCGLAVRVSATWSNSAEKTC